MSKKIQLINLNFNQHEPPEFKALKNKDYVNFGAKNDYPEYLIDLYNKSSKHRALIDGKCSFIAGMGFKISNEFNLANSTKVLLNGFINSVNENDETLSDLVKFIAKDRELFGGYYLELIWSNDGERIASVNHLPFEYVRTNEDKTQFYYTKDWNRKPEKNEDFEVIKAFNANDNSGKAVLAVSNSKEIYPLPSYLSAIPYIECDYEIANYHINNIQNGFSGGYLLNFSNGVPSPEEAAEIERQIQDKHTGSGNAGRFVLNFSDGKDKAAEVIPLQPNNLDKQFIQLNEQVQKEIYIAHKTINPSLFGVMSGNGGLSNNADELRVAHDSFQSRYANPIQDEITNVFNKIGSVNGYPKALELKKLEPIKEQLSNEVRVSVMTQDEIRAELGLEPLNNSTSMTKTEFKDTKDNLILDFFNEVGESASNFDILKTKEVDYNDINEFRLEDDKAKKELFAVINDLSENDIKVLNVIRQNPNATVSQISAGTGLNAVDVNNSLTNLESAGATTIEDGRRELTNDGLDTIENEPETEILVKYRYVTRTDVQPARTGSRDFCKRMLSMNKLFSREDIDRLNNGMGTDVWTTRGGWYTQPNTGRRLRACRHMWQQVIVRRKIQ